MVEETKPHRDGRYFTKEGKLNQSSVGWGLLNAAIAWLHDGSKSLRGFEGWREGRWNSGEEFNKDALNGKEEAVLRVTSSKDRVEAFCKSKLQMSQGTLKSGERLGASTLIKRLWHEKWLNNELGVNASRLRKAMPMPNTRSVAGGRPFAQDLSDAESPADESDASDVTDKKENYFAILALDGDQMGKWISGSHEKTPRVRDSLSPKAIEYFEANACDFLAAPRSITPSWHLQFSEALGNFALHAVQRVVESFNGRLIYAGGDDVLAMLPAREAIPCARALRAAFRGESSLNELALGRIAGIAEQRCSDRKTPLFAIQHPGFLQLAPNPRDVDGLLSDPVTFPVLLPGPATDVSVGIAMAHFKAPLQDVVRAAQKAEKRAKNELGRAALAVTLFKRSGETLEWGCKWAADPDNPDSGDSAGYRLLHALLEALDSKGPLNFRFPHKLEALLNVYLPTSDKVQSDPAFEQSFEEVLNLELDHCLMRNEGGKLDEASRSMFAAYWKETPGENFKERLTALINLLRTAAWARSREKSDTTQPA